MTNKNIIYINPIGNVNHYDISYNNLQNYINNKETIQARLEDTKKKYDSNNSQLVLWSLTSGVLLLIFLVLLRNINNF